MISQMKEVNYSIAVGSLQHSLVTIRCLITDFLFVYFHRCDGRPDYIPHRWVPSPSYTCVRSSTAP